MSTNSHINEDVIKHAKETFCKIVALKLELLYKFVKKGTNSELTGDFVEELVRGFIQNWIGHRVILNGTFYSEKFIQSREKGLQIDGIIYDNTLGPLVLKEGNFAIVHPRFCPGVIEIKTSFSGDIKTVEKFKERLEKIYRFYMNRQSKNTVMGIVIADKNPEKSSKYPMGKIIANSYEFLHGDFPVFILYEKKDDDTYEPFHPAIDNMMRAIYNLQNYSADCWIYQVQENG